MALGSQKFDKEEKISGRFNLLYSRLTRDEARLLEELSKETGLSKDEICDSIFYNSATAFSIAKFRDTDPRLSKLLEKISQRISELGDYREIKKDYLSLVEKIRNPENA
ncbi:MAG: hypothetical protein N3G74_02405 [Candidatus Micrarchaeota archaeon]|nr:hypothetical protein [Candidatus Micrarchaeota archaeon]